MAIVTTFITTPVVHFMYLKSQQNENGDIEANDHNQFSILVCTEERDRIDHLISIATLFSNRQEHIQVKALLVAEISERPSMHFFSNFYSKLRTSGPKEDFS